MIEDNTGTLLYIALLEIFTKSHLFTQPEKMVKILYGTLEVFIKKTIEQTPEEKKIEMKNLFIKGFKELIFRIEENY